MTSDCKSRRREISTNPRLLWMLNNFSLVTQTMAWASSGGIHSEKCLHMKGTNKVLKQTLWLDFKLVCSPLQPWMCPAAYFIISLVQFQLSQSNMEEIKANIVLVASRMKCCIFLFNLFPSYWRKKFGRLWWERNALTLSTNTKARSKICSEFSCLPEGRWKITSF